MSTPSDRTLRLERTKLTPQAPRGKNTTLIAAIIAGLAAAVLAFVVINQRQPPPQQQQPAPTAATIVVTTADLPARTLITPAELKTESVDPSKAPSNYATGEQDVVGKVALQPIAGGTTITNDMIAPKSFDVLSMAGLIPPGDRGMTIALDPQSSVGGFLKPGDHVDVLATFDNGAGRAITRTVLQNVVLLATGAQVIDATPPPTTGEVNVGAPNSTDAAAAAAQPTSIPNATVAVSPIDSEKLVMAGAKGKLMITLRATNDTAQIPIPIVDASAITTFKSISTPVVRPIPPLPPLPPMGIMPVAAPTEQITVIRGGVTTQVAVPT